MFSCIKRDVNDHSMDVPTIQISDDLNGNLLMSSFVDTIEFIPLETTGVNLIGEINNIISKDNKYYIRSTQGKRNSKIQVYDSNGSFLFMLNKQGNGPGEYTDFKDFALDDSCNIYVIAFRKNIVYDSKGDFLYEYKTEEVVKECILRDNETLLMYDFNASLHDNMLLNIVGVDGKLKKRFFERTKKDAISSDSRVQWRSLASYKDVCYFNYPYNDTIFVIEKEHVLSAYFVNYGSRKVPVHIFSDKDNRAEQDKKLSKISDYIKTTAFGVADNYLYVSSIDKSFKGYLTLHSLNSQHTLTGRKLVDDMFLQGNIIPLTAKQLPHNMIGNDILFELEPKYLIKGYNDSMSKLSELQKEKFKQKYPRLVQICESLKEDDNPVLLRIKVKDF